MRTPTQSDQWRTEVRELGGRLNLIIEQVAAEAGLTVESVSDAVLRGGIVTLEVARPIDQALARLEARAAEGNGKERGSHVE